MVKEESHGNATDYMSALNLRKKRWKSGSFLVPWSSPIKVVQLSRISVLMRNYLSKTRKFSAATVNQYLAAIRSFVRHYDGTITVRGMAKMMHPISPLNGRELGRLLAITDGDAWLNQRNRALIELMARAGLRVSEIVDLRITDVTISQRKGEILVRHGKGMKERKIPSRKA